MTEKDWIILITPIIFNGVYIYIVQVYMKRYFEKKERMREQKNMAYGKLLEALSNAQRTFYLLFHVRFDSRPQKFMDFLNDAGKNMFEIKMLYDANFNSYSEFEKELTDIFDIWSGIDSCINNIVANQNGKLTEHDRYFLPKEFSNIYDALSRLHNKIFGKIL